MRSVKGQRPPRALIVGGLVALAVVLAVARTWNTGVNGDLMYVLGGLRAARDGGVPFDEIFVARPFAYKVWIAALDLVRSVFVDDPSSLAGMRAVRLSADVVVLLVAAVLFAGLRRWVGNLPAACSAAAVAVSLIVSPRFNFLEPDWTAALAAVLAGGLLLCFANEKVAWTLGGLALWLTVAMKLSTATFAAVAVVLVFVLSRRRAVGGAIVGAAACVAWYVTSRLVQPIEWRWFNDQAALVHDSPIHHAPRIGDMVDLSEAVLNAALMSPIIVGGVAAAVFFVVRRASGRERRFRSLVVLSCAALAVASGFAQGEWFLYHFSDLAILSAVVWGLALGMAGTRERWILAGGPVLAGVVAMVVMPSFEGHDRPRYLTLLVGTVVATTVPAVLLWRESRRSGAAATPRSPRSAFGGVLAVTALVALVAGMTTARPDMPLTIVGYDAKKAPPTTPAQIAASLAAQERLGDRLGRNTPVLYLAYGSTVFAFPNPTPCPYPSPQWVQRTMVSTQVDTYWSYRENFACLSDARAKYMVRGTSWFDPTRMPAQVQRTLSREFDCSREVRAGVPGLQICPRRH